MLADRAYNPLCLSIWQSAIKTRKSTVLHIWPWVCVADGNSNTFVIMYMMMLWNHEILWQPYSEISLIYRCYWVRFQFCHPIIWIYCVVPLFLVNYAIKWIIFYVQMQLQSVLPLPLCWWCIFHCFFQAKRWTEISARPPRLWSPCPVRCLARGTACSATGPPGLLVLRPAPAKPSRESRWGHAPFWLITPGKVSLHLSTVRQSPAPSCMEIYADEARILA